ncbi:MAG: alpha/beta hydrolase [Rhodospirillales bacterium]|nr:MAG: alpha/beta hydrolase [Rhodospirillales bacterium]
MDSPFMTRLAEGIAGHGVRVVRFEFPYMAAMGRDGRRRPPDRAPVLVKAWKGVVADVAAAGPGAVAIGGKSLGGRIASMVADDLGVLACLCFGYPFHPPGRPENTRTAHLATLATPTLILQGTRDTFGTPEEVAGYPLSPGVRVHWLEAGDHGFATPARHPRTTEDNMAEAIAAVMNFLAVLKTLKL